ncbi:hypothetical protein [Kineococcus sp. SYSU DK006]|uniref:hypothetical protein n=1 Tax=Kineococcus sp. SYSU DK006 TaxID=3383127 RepID=UPI003D7E7185
MSAPDPTRRGVRAIVRALAPAVALVVLVSCTSAEEPTPPGSPLTFGTLLSMPERFDDEARAGVRAAMLELSWRDVEPEEGDFDEERLEDFARGVADARAAGRTVTLGLGLHYTPDWVGDLEDGHYVDASGRRSEAANFVFSAAVRGAAEDYVRRVARTVDLSSIAAVRLTSGGSPEVLYPGGGRFWAFNTGALSGDGLPASMLPNPFPQWRPGGGGRLTPEQARAWVDWYVGGLVDVVRWQRELLAELRFDGDVHVLTPGSGVRPRRLERALRSNLEDDLLGTGAVWQLLYDRLPADGRTVAFITSVADSSGGDDECAPGDAAVALTDPRADGWSATRWITRVATENGLRVSGENPGYGLPEELERSYRDGRDSGMMAAAFRQVASCGLEGLYWAHDAQLWNGTADWEQFAALVRGAQQGNPGGGRG